MTFGGQFHPSSKHPASTFSRGVASTLENSHPLCVGEDVRVHGGFEFASCGAGLKVECGAESVEAEEVAMRAAWRRARPTVADAAEIVSSLMRAGGKRLLNGRYGFRR